MEHSLRLHGNPATPAFWSMPTRANRAMTPSRYAKVQTRLHGAPLQELQALRDLPLFEGLDASVLERLARHCRLQAYSKNQEIACSPDTAPGFHFLVAGGAKVQLETAGGRKKVVEIVGPGYSFDECIPMDAQRQHLRVVSVGASRVLSIAKDVVLDELQAYPPLALRFISSMSRRMGQLLVELNSHIFDNAMQRFVRYIVNQLVPAAAVDSHEPVTVTLPAGKAIVASRLSLSPEYFSRMLRQLETEQLITVNHRTIAIPDLARLVATYGPQYA